MYARATVIPMAEKNAIQVIAGDEAIYLKGCPIPLNR